MAVGPASDGRVVGHQDDGAAVARELSEERDDLPPAARVEVASRLVGEEDRRVVGERPRDRHSLLLPAREARRAVPLALRLDPDLRQEGARPLAPPPRRAPRQGEGQGDILQRRQRGDEVERLEDEADPLAAEPIDGAPAQEGLS